MAALSSFLAWRIPWTEEPSGLQSMGSHRVGHNWVTWQQMVNDVEYLFTGLLAISMSCLGKCPFQSSAHFLTGLFCSWILWVLCVLWILMLYRIHDLQILSHIPQVIFSFDWWLPLLCRNLLIWCSLLTYFFLLYPLFLMSNRKNHCYGLTSFPRSFLALGLMFKFLIYFELIQKSFKMSIWEAKWGSFPVLWGFPGHCLGDRGCCPWASDAGEK